jgi:hypothetical protein
MPIEEEEDDPFPERPGPELDEGLDNEPIIPEGLGAIGQLGSAVILVALLVAAFVFGSAFLRRLFG